MAGGWRAAVLLLLLLLLVTSDSAAGRTPSAMPTPSTSTSVPPPASLLVTSPPPPSSTPATPATSSGASSSNVSASKALESGALAPPSGWFTSPPIPSAVPALVLGCEPMKLANALFKHCCDAPRPEPIPNARCCGAAVSAVARPTCFCLVQQETAFVLSSFYNRSSMGRLLDICGALPGLRRVVDDPSRDNMDDHGCASPVKASASCRSYKIATIVGWTLVCVLLAAVLYALLWRPVPEVEQDDALALREGCRCIKSKCRSKICGCNKRDAGCTAACQCRGCANPYGIRRATAALEMGGLEG